MGFSSQSGQVILRSQATPGVAMADLGTAGMAVRLRSGSMAVNRDVLTLDPEIGGGRDTSDAYLGPANFSGDYEMYPRFDSIPIFLRAALGQAVSVASGGVNTHTITPVDGQLPYLTIYEEISSNLERYLYHDCVVNTIHFEADANGLLMATAGMIGRFQEVGVPDIDGSALYDTTATAVGTSVSLTYNGLSLPGKSFGFDLTNNVEDDDFRLGSFFVGDLTAKEREVTGSFTIRHENSALQRQATLGLAAATEIGGKTTKQELVINMVSYDSITGSTPATPYSMKITIPNVMIQPFAFEPSGSDILETDISWTALRPDPAVPILTVEVKNGKAAIA